MAKVVIKDAIHLPRPAFTSISEKGSCSNANMMTSQQKGGFGKLLFFVSFWT